MCLINKYDDHYDFFDRWKRRLEERALEKEHERLKREQREREREAQLRQDEQANSEMEVINLDSGSENDDVEETKEGNMKDANKIKEKAELMDIDERLENLKPLPTPEELEMRRKKEEEENAALKAEYIKKNREYRLEMAEAAARYSITPLGEDRIYRRFWLFSSVPGLFVERDLFYLADMDLSPVAQKEAKRLIPSETSLPEVQTDKSGVDKDQDTSTSSNKENIDMEAVNGGMETDVSAPQEKLVKEPLMVNGVIAEVKPQEHDPCMLDREHAQWAYYSTPEELKNLLSSLNHRGFREKALKEVIIHEVMRIEQSLKSVPLEALNSINKEVTVEDRETAKRGVTRQVVVKMNSGKKGLVSDEANGDEALELLLREQLLDIEERVWNGSLGIIKVSSKVEIDTGIYASEAVYTRNFFSTACRKACKHAFRFLRVLPEAVSTRLSWL